jgi:hypothetical protein
MHRSRTRLRDSHTFSVVSARPPPPDRVMVEAMATPFRDMPDVLGNSERESAAIHEYGRWQARVKSIVLAAFAFGAFVPAVLAFWGSLELQFALNDGVAFIKLSVIGGIAVWVITMLIGRVVARRVVNARTPAKVAQLAQAYEVSADELAKTTDLSRQF